MGPNGPELTEVNVTVMSLNIETNWTIHVNKREYCCPCVNFAKDKCFCRFVRQRPCQWGILPVGLPDEIERAANGGGHHERKE